MNVHAGCVDRVKDANTWLRGLAQADEELEPNRGQQKQNAVESKHQSSKMTDNNSGMTERWEAAIRMYEAKRGDGGNASKITRDLMMVAFDKFLLYHLENPSCVV